MLAAPILVALALFILWRRLDSTAWTAAFAHLRSYSPQRIAGGVGLVALSFALLGAYEASMLRELGRALGLVRPMIIATCANAIGHSVGLATLSGGALRYRFYAAAGLSNSQIGALVALSAMPFLLGISLLLGLALRVHARQASTVLHLPTWLVVLFGILGLALNLGYILLTAARFRLSVGRFVLPLPRLGFALQQLGFGVTEIFCVAGLLYLFMPPELGMGLLGFMIVYLISIVLGQLSSVPAGLGVLEASLLVMLPHVPADKLLAAVIAYRLLFEALPLIAAVVLCGAYEWNLRLRRTSRASPE